MSDVFPYQRLSLDAGTLSHPNRMLIPEDGGKRLTSGVRIRTSLALLCTCQYVLGRRRGGTWPERSLGVTGRARVGGGNE